MICALENNENLDNIIEEYSDIVAIGTIADVMPMVDENRLIVTHGIQRLAKTKNIGLRALMRNSGIISGDVVVKKVNSTTVGFVIAPRINAAGRIASASLAAKLLLAQSPEEAEKISDKLCEINRMRQETEKKIFDEAVLMTNEGNFGDDSILVLANEGWHQGVIGVVADSNAKKISINNMEYNGSFTYDAISGQDTFFGFAIGRINKAATDGIYFTNVRNLANVNITLTKADNTDVCIGILGRIDVSGSKEVVFENCYNAGNITVNAYNANTSSRNHNVGGLVGLYHSTSPLTIKNCYNTGNLALYRYNVSASFNASGVPGDTDRRLADLSSSSILPCTRIPRFGVYKGP